MIVTYKPLPKEKRCVSQKSRDLISSDINLRKRNDVDMMFVAIFIPTSFCQNIICQKLFFFFSREKFGWDIHKDVAYGAGYLMEGQG